MTSRLDYCNALLGGCPASSINKLQVVQNAAARVLTRSRKYDHITPILQSLHWLPIKFRISYKILLLAYKALNGLAPAAVELTNGHYADAENKTEDASGGKKDFSLFCDERGYLSLVEFVLQKGARRGDRTGTGTGVISVFGTQARYSLKRSFPLLTTKRVFWKGILEELLWFIKGSTNAKELSEKGVRIWDANGSREFLDKSGFSDREEGDLGPVYGFQWRHFGAEYKDMHTDYSGQGVDQLQKVIDTITSNPEDRRIIMCAWNPKGLSQYYLCVMIIFINVLDCLYTFFLCIYALLTYMIAHITGLKPGDFVHTLGDAHIYTNHIEPLKEQIRREPRPFPKLRIKRKVERIDDFQAEDVEIYDYDTHPAIKMQMAV
uniref:Thymidylate synthase n=1 Tax=Sinocyclocheilus rhinocerous TaxID=307959 RepID=A0A673LB04_9TELE